MPRTALALQNERAACTAKRAVSPDHEWNRDQGRRRNQIEARRAQLPAAPVDARQKQRPAQPAELAGSSASPATSSGSCTRHAKALPAVTTHTMLDFPSLTSEEPHAQPFSCCTAHCCCSSGRRSSRAAVEQVAGRCTDSKKRNVESWRTVIGARARSSKATSQCSGTKPLRCCSSHALRPRAGKGDLCAHGVHASERGNAMRAQRE